MFFLRTESLGTEGVLEATIKVPDAVANIEVLADLGSRQVTTHAWIKAPGEGFTKTRINWLLHQPKDVKGQRLGNRRPRRKAEYVVHASEAIDNQPTSDCSSGRLLPRIRLRIRPRLRLRIMRPPDTRRKVSRHGSRTYISTYGAPKVDIARVIGR